MFIFNWDGHEVKIRSKEEFDKLNDEEKLEYFNEGLEENGCSINEEWLINAYPTADDIFYIEELKEKYMEKYYPIELKKLITSSEDKEDELRKKFSSLETKQIKIADFLENEIAEIDDATRWDLFFMNSIYNEYYFSIFQCIRYEENVLVTHEVETSEVINN